MPEPTELEAAWRDHAFANGMHHALVMAAQGAEDKAARVAERLRAESLRVIKRKG